MKRFPGILAATAICGFYLAAFPAQAGGFFSLAGSNFLVVLSILPPVFILLGLFDAWVPRERVTALIGEKSGLVGAGLSIFLGSFAAGPCTWPFPSRKRC